jgi:hypothetical protein
MKQASGYWLKESFTAIRCYCYSLFGAEMLAAAEEELVIGAEQGFPLWRASGILHKGSAMCLQGHASKGVPFLLEGFSAFRRPVRKYVPWYRGILANAHTEKRRFGEARSALTEAQKIVEKNDDWSYQAELYRLEGELHLAETDYQYADED